MELLAIVLMGFSYLSQLARSVIKCLQATHLFMGDKIFNLFPCKYKQIMKMKDILLSVFMALNRILQPVLYRSGFLLIIKLQKPCRIFLKTDEWARWRNNLNQAKYHKNLSWMKQSGENEKKKIMFKWLAMITKALTLRLVLQSWPVEEAI